MVQVLPSAPGKAPAGAGVSCRGSSAREPFTIWVRRRGGGEAEAIETGAFQALDRPSPGGAGLEMVDELFEEPVDAFDVVGMTAL